MPLDCKVRSKTPELVLFVHGYGVLAVQDIDSFSTFFNVHLHGNTPFKVFFDLRNVSSAPMGAVTAMASYMSSFEKLAQGKVVASSVVVNSYAIESLLNLLFSLKKPTTPTKVTSDLQVACDFLNDFDCVIEDEN